MPECKSPLLGPRKRMRLNALYAIWVNLLLTCFLRHHACCAALSKLSLANVCALHDAGLAANTSMS